jgi:hypothetical protein
MSQTTLCVCHSLKTRITYPKKHSTLCSSCWPHSVVYTASSWRICSNLNGAVNTHARAHTHTHIHTKHIAYTYIVQWIFQHVHCSVLFYWWCQGSRNCSSFRWWHNSKMLRLYVFLASEIGFSVFNERMHFLLPVFIEDTQKIMLKLLRKCCAAVPHLLLGYV